MIGPSVYGQAIIILVYVPLLTFSGVEGKMFEPMALTVILALVAAFVLSLTFVPALIAIVVTGRVTRRRQRRGSLSEDAATRRCSARTISRPLPAIVGAVVLFAGRALLVFLRLGQEFIPTLDEKNRAMHALRIPSTSLTQSQAMQLDVEKTVSALPQVAFVFSKTGTAEIASDPMPPNASDTFIILKPQAQWPDPKLTKDAWSSRSKRPSDELPGNNYEFTQPIQMRFNELLAGVRGDVAVKVFGDEFEPLLRVANQIAAILRATKGATDVKVEQAERPFGARHHRRQGRDRPARPEPGGRAGRDRHRDRRPRCRRRVRRRPPFRDRGAAAGHDPQRSRRAQEPAGVAAPAGSATPTVPLGQLASFTLREGPNQISRENGKRRVVVTANVRDRDIASVVNDARDADRGAGEAAGRLLDDLGRPVRESGGGAPASRRSSCRPASC